MTQPRSDAACSPVPLDPFVGLEAADMDIVDRLHGYAMLHKGMTPESWAMAEARDEIIGLRGIAAAQRDLITALERVADISITALAEKAANVFDVAEIERKLKTLAVAKAACITPIVATSAQVTLPDRPEPEDCESLSFDAYSGMQMLAYGRACAEAQRLLAPNAALTGAEGVRVEGTVMRKEE